MNILRKIHFVRWLMFFLLTSGGMINCFAATDDDPLYQIEIIVFSHVTEKGLKSEYWPSLPPLIPAPNTIELSQEQMLPDSQWTLKSQEKLLKQNNYVILMHWAWQESASDLRKGQVIHLAGGDNYPNNLRPVDGAVAIQLDRFFSLHFDLRLSLPWADIKDYNLINLDRNNNDYVTFKIDQRLRMRSNELNYIDHPLFGILVNVSPV